MSEIENIQTEIKKFRSDSNGLSFIISIIMIFTFFLLCSILSDIKNEIVKTNNRLELILDNFQKQSLEKNIEKK